MDGTNLRNRYEKKKDNRGNEITSVRQKKVEYIGVPLMLEKTNTKLRRRGFSNYKYFQIQLLSVIIGVEVNCKNSLILNP